MFRTLTPLLGAALLAASTSLFAQGTATPPAGGPAAKGGHRFDCSQAKDPKACEERRAKAREAREYARKQCEGKTGAEHRDCMIKEGCSKAQDPAKCEANLKARAEKRKDRVQQKNAPAQGK
jgi:Spy/CpxP family protein refolding chaperone